jgi:hypothetical protein
MIMMSLRKWMSGLLLIPTVNEDFSMDEILMGILFVGSLWALLLIAIFA